MVILTRQFKEAEKKKRKRGSGQTILNLLTHEWGEMERCREKGREEKRNTLTGLV